MERFAANSPRGRREQQRDRWRCRSRCQLPDIPPTGRYARSRATSSARQLGSAETTPRFSSEVERIRLAQPHDPRASPSQVFLPPDRSSSSLLRFDRRSLIVTRALVGSSLPGPCTAFGFFCDLAQGNLNGAGPGQPDPAAPPFPERPEIGTELA